jgi:ABC-type methionine transport system ATPase subunit
MRVLLDECLPKRLRGGRLSGRIIKTLNVETPVAKRRVHLSFPGKLKDEPLLWRTCEQFDLIFNIRQADYTEGMGWLMAELEGDGEQLEKGIRWLEEQGVIVAPIEQDVVQ